MSVPVPVPAASGSASASGSGSGLCSSSASESTSSPASSSGSGCGSGSAPGSAASLSFSTLPTRLVQLLNRRSCCWRRFCSQRSKRSANCWRCELGVRRAGSSATSKSSSESSFGVCKKERKNDHRGEAAGQCWSATRTWRSNQDKLVGQWRKRKVRRTKRTANRRTDFCKIVLDMCTTI